MACVPIFIVASEQFLGPACYVFIVAFERFLEPACHIFVMLTMGFIPNILSTNPNRNGRYIPCFFLS
jgi:hypothetical protein